MYILEEALDGHGNQNEKYDLNYRIISIYGYMVAQCILTDILKRKPKIMFSQPLLIELLTNEDTKIVYSGIFTRWTYAPEKKYDLNYTIISIYGYVAARCI